MIDSGIVINKNHKAAASVGVPVRFQQSDNQFNFVSIMLCSESSQPPLRRAALHI